MKPKLLMIGFMSMDTLDGPEGLKEVQGGGAVYSAVSASLNQAPVGLVTRIGEDYKEDYIRNLERVGIDLSSVKQVKGESSRWVITHDKEKVRHLGYGINVGWFINPKDILPQLLENVKIVHICSTPPENQLRFIKFFQKNKDVKISIDTKIEEIVRQPDIFINDVLPQANYYFPNRFEAIETHFQLEGKAEENIDRIGQRIAELVKEFIIIKDASNGAYYYDKEMMFHLPAHKSNVVELTGAGDTFVGAFLANLLRGKALNECLAYGNASASFVIENYGMLRMFNLNRIDLKDRAADILKGGLKRFV